MNKKAMPVFMVGVLLVIVGLFMKDDRPMPIEYDLDDYRMIDSFDRTSDEVMDFDTLLDKADAYLSVYDQLVIKKIIVFENRGYEFIVYEKDTNRAALELYANPYSGDIYPGINGSMMWNGKYGMHNAYHMHGGREAYRDADYLNQGVDNTLTPIEAKEIASDYIEKLDRNFSLMEEMNFYGYYAYFVRTDENIAGILRINGFNGEAWLQQFGEGTEIIAVE